MSRVSGRSASSIAVATLLAIAIVAAVALPHAVRAEGPPDHLVVSEVVTGGASASDEFIEIYNPTAGTLPLEGLELVYVTASGATVSRRAAWALGAPSLAPGRHVLIANELGAYAGIADAAYASGLAAAGGSVALRIQGASSAIDAVGWGTAASTWMEGQAAPAPASGSSIERLPGGTMGSTVDTDDNRSDFATRPLPEPQNSGSAPVPETGATPPPTATAAPSVDPTAQPTPAPTTSPTPAPTAPPTPAPTPGSQAVPIAMARALPDGTEVTVEGTALSDSDFTDGGGYVADTSGGLAAIVSGAAFARGDLLRLTGTIDDRFSQRTLRVEAAGLARLGAGTEPGAAPVGTGAVGEAVEGTLVRVSGSVVGPPSELSTGVAFDLDDGSGPTRLVVSTATGIDASGWKSGTGLVLVGIVGQRDSTGSGMTGYRVQPRSAADIASVHAPPTATPQPSASASAEPSPVAGLITIAEARSAPKNAPVRVRGTVTMAPGIVDATTAVVQDATGAIVLRIGDEVGTLSRGQSVQVDGIRSTKGGMETVRVTRVPTQLGQVTEPVARALKTGDAGERDEARLVVVRGAVTGVRRYASGTVSFELDDGSGPLRVSIAGAANADGGSLASGAWLEVTGVLGQETSGAQPLRGYRVWPRDASDLRLLAAPTLAGDTHPEADAGGRAAAAASVGGLEALGGAAGESARIGATLVAVAWPELGIGGLLWDGSRVVALDPSAAAAAEGLLDGRRPPISVELSGLRAVGAQDALDLPIVRLGDQPDALLPGTTPPVAPAAAMPANGERPRWVSVVGTVSRADRTSRLALPGGRSIVLEVRCSGRAAALVGSVGVHGIAVASPPRIVVPCAGVRPVPSLGRVGVVTPPAGPSGGAAALAGLGSSGSGEQSLPVAPAALLATAALGLLAAALVARRGSVTDPDPAVREDSSSDEAEPPPALPALTLVPLPRDRAP